MHHGDAQLIEEFVRNKSQAAFATLVQRHADLVYSAALRQAGGDAHLARDISQSVFLTLARKAPGLVGRTSIAGWLYSSTRNFAIRAIRDHKRWRKREQEANAMKEESSRMEELQWSRAEPIIDEAMHDLGTADREILLMRFFENRSFAAIGLIHGLKENTARMRVERAMDKLQSVLARRGITSTAAVLSCALATQAVSAAPVDLARSLGQCALAGTAGGSSSASILKFMITSKLQAGLLGISLLANVGMLASTGALDFPAFESSATTGITPQLEARSGAASTSIVSAVAGTLVGDLRDPEFLARKLKSEGYPQHIIIDAVRMAARIRRDEETQALYEPFSADLALRTRWRTAPPKPIPEEVQERDRAILREARTEAHEILRTVLGNAADLPVLEDGR